MTMPDVPKAFTMEELAYDQWLDNPSDDLGRVTYSEIADWLSACLLAGADPKRLVQAIIHHAKRSGETQLSCHDRTCPLCGSSDSLSSPPAKMPIVE